RIIVQRERERMAFVAAGYWDLEGSFATADGEEFGATLVSLDGTRVATGRDFSSAGEKTTDAVALDEAAARALVEDLAGRPADVRSVDTKPYTRKPYPAFRTSTLQQESGRKLRFSSARTMRAAQRLYENGYITYMRTDSISLSETAITATRSEIEKRYGADHMPDAPRVYQSKVKNAQEAHEAIRPAGDSFKDPEQVSKELGPQTDEARLYDLVWKRTVASQMADARGESVQVRIGATTTSGRDTEFATSGKVIHFAGFLRAYVEGSDDPDADLEDQERRLPAIAAGDGLGIAAVAAVGHETKPPARYTEASLVKRLEELGIGRPSTYASIIQTIQERGYVWKRASALIPSFTAFATITLLERHFPSLVDYDFTARMEDDLDQIAGGTQESVPWLTEFYFGNGHPGLKRAVSEGLGDIDAREINSIPIGDDPEGRTIVARVGRYGPYLERGEDRASIPEDLPPDELSVERAAELLDAPSDERVLGEDPESGLEVIARPGRFGPYLQLGTPDDYDKKSKPKTASLFKTMDLETIDLETALLLLSLPREVGSDPGSGEVITAQNGRYGPYIKRGSDTRSLETEEQIFSVTLEEALAVLAEPKRGRGRAAPRPPLRDLGVDPDTGFGIEIRDGRFGPYVTDGGENASLRKDDTIESMTVERARELLAARRDRIEAQGKKPKPGKKRES
ncbi:MAG TPA: type I DNA topoisomerase, partial [Acidimicrobiia bacterium]|nr:type I DNA topoisomerase [Acidimicrobiia bacterium]